MLEGQELVRITCHGKNLVLHTDDGTAVRAHRRMTGAWSRSPQAPTTLEGVDLALDVGGTWVVARDMPVLEILRPGGFARHPGLRALGPDLLGLTLRPDGPEPLAMPDLDVAVLRARQVPTRPVHAVLLDQRVACGLGNVYKSELLFLHGMNPWRAAGSLSEAAWRALYEQGRALLIANTRPGRRTTRGEGRTGATWVYGRAGRPCLRCRTPIRLHPGEGPLPRRTEWCPRCQPDDTDAAPVR